MNDVSKLFRMIEYCSRCKCEKEELNYLKFERQFKTHKINNFMLL